MLLFGPLLVASPPVDSVGVEEQATNSVAANGVISPNKILLTCCFFNFFTHLNLSVMQVSVKAFAYLVIR